MSSSFVFNITTQTLNLVTSRLSSEPPATPEAPSVPQLTAPEVPAAPVVSAPSAPAVSQPPVPSNIYSCN